MKTKFIKFKYGVVAAVMLASTVLGIFSGVLNPTSAAAGECSSGQREYALDAYPKTYSLSVGSGGQTLKVRLEDRTCFGWYWTGWNDSTLYFHDAVATSDFGWSQTKSTEFGDWNNWNSFTFDPSSLAPGTYHIYLNVANVVGWATGWWSSYQNVVTINIVAAPIADTDGDGVSDDADLCPNTGAGLAVDADGCAENQKDDDGDDVTNDLDKCPNTEAGVEVDAEGCLKERIDEEAPEIVLIAPTDNDKDKVKPDTIFKVRATDDLALKSMTLHLYNVNSDGSRGAAVEYAQNRLKPAIDGKTEFELEYTHKTGAGSTLPDGRYLLIYSVSDQAGKTAGYNYYYFTIDTKLARIVINGDSPMYLEQNVDIYTELNAYADDEMDGIVDLVPGAVNYAPCVFTLTGAVVSCESRGSTTGVDTTKAGVYAVGYRYTDKGGNTKNATRLVYVRDTRAPKLFLNGGASISFEVGVDNGGDLRLGAYATDEVDGLVDPLRPVFINYHVDGKATNLCDESKGKTCAGFVIDWNKVGEYRMVYRYTDAAGHKGVDNKRADHDYVQQNIRIVDTQAPEISIVGDNPEMVFIGEDWANRGILVTDNYDDEYISYLTDNIHLHQFNEATGKWEFVKKVDAVDTSVPGQYRIGYTFPSDASGNRAVVTGKPAATVLVRVVYVVDNKKPTAKLTISDDGKTMSIKATDNYALYQITANIYNNESCTLPVFKSNLIKDISKDGNVTEYVFDVDLSGLVPGTYCVKFNALDNQYAVTDKHFYEFAGGRIKGNMSETGSFVFTIEEPEEINNGIEEEIGGLGENENNAAGIVGVRLNSVAESSGEVAIVDSAAQEDGDLNGDGTKDVVAEKDTNGEVLGATDGEDEKYWAPLNLVMAGLTVLAGIIVVIAWFGKDESDKNRNTVWRWLTLVPAAGALVAFFLTEDWTLTARWVDEWTWLITVILAVQIGLVTLASRETKKGKR